MKSQVAYKILSGMIVLFLASQACSSIGGPQAPTAPPAPTQPPAEGTLPPTPGQNTLSVPTVPPVSINLTPEQIYGKPFAQYSQVNVKLPASAPASYTLPVDLNSVEGMADYELSVGQKEALSRSGFSVAAPVAGQYREFYQIYENIRYNYKPVFITTDSIFHVYHLLFDKMLRDLEREKFIPTLKSLTSTLLTASYNQYQSLRGTNLEEPALRNTAYFGIAAQLLALPDPIPQEASALVSAELALIEAHSGVNKSPIWDRSDLPEDKKLIEDYSQYVPRGHYTRSEELKQYFKSMMWYGRLTFRLRDPFETRRALLMIQVLRNSAAPEGTPAIQMWESIFEPTVFIVGKADDLSFKEYGAISDVVFGANPDPKSFGDDTLLAQFNQAAKQLPPPQVNSMWVWIWEDRDEATQGFRFMGQRFTLDAYVFGQVMWRKVGTLEKPRDLPKALDFFAAMGSTEALDILNAMGENQYDNYSAQMDKVKGEVAQLQLDSWTQNLYWSWLFAFQPIITPKDARYPLFMQNQAWTRKDLQTALGSWTELKHDTILYAKQVMAEMGGGPGEEPPMPHSYVEPNPEAYARLLALAQMTYDGLQSRNLLNDNIKANLENLMNTLTFLKDISEKELAGQEITKDEYQRMLFYGGELEAYTLAAADPEEGQGRPILEDQKAALVADVATGIGRVLEEGVGQPTPIYVVLPDQPWRIAVGAVYTYYEFTVPPAERMTDETWQGQVEAGTNPPQPDWTSMFIIP